MASILKVDKLDPQSGTALEIGTSGDTITVPSGATFAVSGTMNASSITAGTLAVARGGTGRTAVTGNVLQVIRATTTTISYTDSTSMVDITDLTVNITPSATSSNVFVIMNVNGITSSSSAIAGCSLRIYQASDVSGEAINIGYGTTDALEQSATLTALESPSSTSELTYKGQFKNRIVSDVGVNIASDTSSITVMEIAG
jgi:hypothetical protein